METVDIAQTWPALSYVLLGVDLRTGGADLGLLALVALGWLATTVPVLRRDTDRVNPGLARVLCIVLGAGVATLVVAGDALLFYVGLALAGYAGTGLMLALRGARAGGAGALAAVLLVCSDLLYFELLAYLYSDAGSARFTALAGTFSEASLTSFVFILAALSAACRVAPCLLLFSHLAGDRQGRAMAVAGLVLGCGLASALLLWRLGAGSPELRWLLVAGTLVSALPLYGLVRTSVIHRERLRHLAQWLSGRGEKVLGGAETLAGGLANTARLGSTALGAVEQWLLRWPVAISISLLLGGALVIALLAG
jgi:hypothetical protein